MRLLLAMLLATGLFAEQLFLVDGMQRTPLMAVASPKSAAENVGDLPHIHRHDPTIALRFEGSHYNHRHLNVRLATLGSRPEYTVLTEYSKAVAPDAYRITFGGYRYEEERVLQVYYEGRWYAALLESLEH